MGGAGEGEFARISLDGGAPGGMMGAQRGAT